MQQNGKAKLAAFLAVILAIYHAIATGVPQSFWGLITTPGVQAPSNPSGLTPEAATLVGVIVFPFVVYFLGSLSDASSDFMLVLVVGLWIVFLMNEKGIPSLGLVNKS